MDLIVFLIQGLFYDGIILSAVSFLLKKRIQSTTFISALILSALLSSIAFLWFPFFLFFVPLALIKYVFRHESGKFYIKATLYFYILSAVLSGVLHMLQYFIRFDLLNLAWQIVVLGLIAFLVTVGYLLKNWVIRRELILDEFERQVTIYYKDLQVTGVGLIDTGNTLVCQETGSPVMMADGSRVAPMLEAIKADHLPIWELNYEVVNGGSGSLAVFKPTLVLFGEHIARDVVVGVSETAFGKYDFLLQPEIEGLL